MQLKLVFCWVKMKQLVTSGPRFGMAPCSVQQLEIVPVQLQCTCYSPITCTIFQVLFIPKKRVGIYYSVFLIICLLDRAVYNPTNRFHNLDHEVSCFLISRSSSQNRGFSKNCLLNCRDNRDMIRDMIQFCGTPFRTIPSINDLKARFTALLSEQFVRSTSNVT